MFGIDLYVIAGAVVAVVAAIGVAFFKGKSSGRDAVVADRSKADDKTRKEFDRIDAGAPDLDSAIDRLRDRSGKRDAGSK